jgi:ribonuclease HI
VTVTAATYKLINRRKRSMAEFPHRDRDSRLPKPQARIPKAPTPETSEDESKEGPRSYVPHPKLRAIPRLSRKRSLKIGNKAPLNNPEANRLLVFHYGGHPMDVFRPSANRNDFSAARWTLTRLDQNSYAVEINKIPTIVSVFVYADGVALGNDQEEVRAGFGVVFNPLDPIGVSRPLELSSEHEPTSDRAALCAALAALQMRYWEAEGFHGILIAIESEYVINGVTKESIEWKKNGWKMANGESVKNRDLWEQLLEGVEKNETKGFVVQFFKLKPEWNKAAEASRMGAVSSCAIF